MRAMETTSLADVALAPMTANAEQLP